MTPSEMNNLVIEDPGPAVKPHKAPAERLYIPYCQKPTIPSHKQMKFNSGLMDHQFYLATKIWLKWKQILSHSPLTLLSLSASGNSSLEWNLLFHWWKVSVNFAFCLATWFSQKDAWLYCGAGDFSGGQNSCPDSFMQMLVVWILIPFTNGVFSLYDTWRNLLWCYY